MRATGAFQQQRLGGTSRGLCSRGVVLPSIARPHAWGQAALRRTACSVAAPEAPCASMQSKHMDKLDKLRMEREKAAMKLAKAEATIVACEAEARGALYLLHWHRAAPSSVLTQQEDDGAHSTSQETRDYIAGLQEELKRMEAVSKDALWYATRDVPDGSMHVLLATANAKTAIKYGLTELPADAATHTVALGGACGSIDVPVGVLKTLVLDPSSCDASSTMASLDSDGDGGGTVMAGEMLKETAIAEEKKREKETRRAEKMKMKAEKEKKNEDRKKEKMRMMGGGEVEECDTDKEARKAEKRQMKMDAKGMHGEKTKDEAKKEKKMAVGGKRMEAMGLSLEEIVEEDPIAKAHVMQLLGAIMPSPSSSSGIGSKAEERAGSGARAVPGMVAVAGEVGMSAEECGDKSKEEQECDSSDSSGSESGSESESSDESEEVVTRYRHQCFPLLRRTSARAKLANEVPHVAAGEWRYRVLCVTWLRACEGCSMGCGDSKQAAHPGGTSPAPVASAQRGGKVQGNGKSLQLEGVSLVGDVRDIYTFSKVLGKGNFGVVHLVHAKKDGKPYACKSISKRKLITAEDVEDVRREVQILLHLGGHENVVQIYGAYEDKSYIHVVMECCHGGELFDRIADQGHFTERAAADVVRTVVAVVHHCHTMNVIHRDLKPENFLLSTTGKDAVLKATDFGLSRFFKDGDSLNEIVGSPFYVAPEVLQRRYGKEADIWSCGVILYILLCGWPPFHGESTQQIFKRIMSQPLDLKSEPWPQISDAAKDCVRRMLARDPKKRLTAAQLLKHPWMRVNGLATDTELKPEVLTRLMQFGKMNALKKEALKIIARSLPGSELQGIREMFKAIDEDNSGTITIDELKEGLRQKGASLASSEVEKIIGDIGDSGNQRIDYDEFIAATIHLNKLNREELMHEAFAHFDKDASGFITPNEMKIALGEVGCSDAEEMQRSVLAAADTNGDGTIDYEEFCTMMRDNDFEKLVEAKSALNRKHALSIVPTASGLYEPPADEATDRQFDVISRAPSMYVHASRPASPRLDGEVTAKLVQGGPEKNMVAA
ncbi:hypothetical protein FOA52_009093 [Chlamydomonas sp. UWO 241]|nr:hypothetical protein FOA52_009093 [Chlamydomonas sp. UWO 241]